LGNKIGGFTGGGVKLERGKKHACVKHNETLR